jgi:hypothetical protein
MWGETMKKETNVYRKMLLLAISACVLFGGYNAAMFACFSAFVRPFDIPIVNYPGLGANVLKVALSMPRLDSMENKTADAIKVSNLVLNRKGGKNLVDMLDSAAASISVLDRFYVRYKNILNAEQKWALLSEQLLIFNRLMFLSNEEFLRQKAFMAIQTMDGLVKDISNNEDLAFYYLEKAVFMNIATRNEADAYRNFELSNSILSTIDDSMKEMRLNTNKLYFALSRCANGYESGYPLGEIIDRVTRRRADFLWLSARNFDAPLIGGLVNNKNKLNSACRHASEKLSAFIRQN